MSKLALQQQMAEAAKERSDIAKALLAIQSSLDKIKLTVSRMEPVLASLAPTINACADKTVEELQSDLGDIRVQPTEIAHDTAPAPSDKPQGAHKADLTEAMGPVTETPLVVETVPQIVPAETDALSVPSSVIYELESQTATRCSMDRLNDNPNEENPTAALSACTSTTKVRTNSDGLGEVLRPRPWPSFIDERTCTAQSGIVELTIRDGQASRKCLMVNELKSSHPNVQVFISSEKRVVRLVEQQLLIHESDASLMLHVSEWSHGLHPDELWNPSYTWSESAGHVHQFQEMLGYMTILLVCISGRQSITMGVWISPGRPIRQAHESAGDFYDNKLASHGCLNVCQLRNCSDFSEITLAATEYEGMQGIQCMQPAKASSEASFWPGRSILGNSLLVLITGSLLQLFSSGSAPNFFRENFPEVGNKLECQWKSLAIVKSDLKEWMFPPVIILGHLVEIRLLGSEKSNITMFRLSLDSGNSLHILFCWGVKCITMYQNTKHLVNQVAHGSISMVQVIELFSGDELGFGCAPAEHTVFVNNLLAAPYVVWCMRCVKLDMEGPPECLPFCQPKPPWHPYLLDRPLSKLVAAVGISPSSVQFNSKEARAWTSEKIWACKCCHLALLYYNNVSYSLDTRVLRCKGTPTIDEPILGGGIASSICDAFYSKEMRFCTAAREFLLLQNQHGVPNVCHGVMPILVDSESMAYKCLTWISHVLELMCHCLTTRFAGLYAEEDALPSVINECYMVMSISNHLAAKCYVSAKPSALIHLSTEAGIGTTLICNHQVALQKVHRWGVTTAVCNFQLQQSSGYKVPNELPHVNQAVRGAFSRGQLCVSRGKKPVPLQLKIAWTLNWESYALSSGGSDNILFDLAIIYSSYASAKNFHHRSPSDHPSCTFLAEVTMAVHTIPYQIPLPVKTYDFGVRSARGRATIHRGRIVSGQAQHAYGRLARTNTSLKIMVECSTLELMSCKVSMAHAADCYTDCSVQLGLEFTPLMVWQIAWLLCSVCAVVAYSSQCAFFARLKGWPVIGQPSALGCTSLFDKQYFEEGGVSCLWPSSLITSALATMKATRPWDPGRNSSSPAWGQAEFQGGRNVTGITPSSTQGEAQGRPTRPERRSDLVYKLCFVSEGGID